MTAQEKEQIISLQSEGKTLAEITKITNLPKTTVRYHLSAKERARVRTHSIQYRAQNPILRKIDAFNQRSKKAFDNKITHFHRFSKGEQKATIELVLKTFGSNPTCYLTGDTLDLANPDSYSFDHKTPVSKGGDNSLSNLGICRMDVNQAKSDKTPEEFIELCKQVLQHNGFDVVKKSEEAGVEPAVGLSPLGINSAVPATNSATPQ
jgi:CRISPR/Cas system Type II protein with McrA/HNH and RuvC-like nuclease domain